MTSCLLLQKLFRQNTKLHDTQAFGKQAFNFNVNLEDRKWLRFEVWDVAANGAFLRKDIYLDAFHCGPINTPEDVRVILDQTEVQGFVGASSLERMGVEESLAELTRKFKSLTFKK